ncbi:MAG TPA: deoxyribose-phosphate aldolase [Chloroflexi bacterium]|nr:deoxyribose-phosphate aldolase [Chloroflexota bacterium]HBY07365.1 deoxyribose-phosphate aldolase [Chloroflexota bacterium]
MTTIPELIQRAKAYELQLPPAPKPLSAPQGAEIARWIDHTILKPEATVHQVKQICQEALEYNFASVCVNPTFVPFVAGMLRDSKVDTCTVIGFPLGATLPTVKMAETLTVISMGATEIDMVINIGALKAQAYGQVLNDIEIVVETAHNQSAIVKVIIETALLNQFEKIMACLLCQEARADFVKTSTGFSTAGATTPDVALMRRIVGARMGVKAAGGIRNLSDAQAMIAAGASRLGASAGVAILQESLG